jgi:hypothetical protein
LFPRLGSKKGAKSALEKKMGTKIAKQHAERSKNLQWKTNSSRRSDEQGKK